MRTHHLSAIGLATAISLGSIGAQAEPFTVDGAGKTALMYDASHGNQVEFYDKDGNCFLWYPGNKKVVRGRWQSQGDSICFQYGPNTYNPVTRERGGAMDCQPVGRWKEHVVDVVPGDAFGLAGPALPGQLIAQPKVDSVAQLKDLYR